MARYASLPIIVCRNVVNTPFTDPDGVYPIWFSTEAEAKAFAEANDGYVTRQTWENAPPAPMNAPPDDPEWETGPQRRSRQ